MEFSASVVVVTHSGGELCVRSLQYLLKFSELLNSETATSCDLYLVDFSLISVLTQESRSEIADSYCT